MIGFYTVKLVSCKRTRSVRTKNYVLVHYDNVSFLVGALITARKQARDRMAKDSISPEEHAVLDGRQKALKVQL